VIYEKFFIFQDIFAQTTNRNTRNLSDGIFENVFKLPLVIYFILVFPGAVGTIVTSCHKMTRNGTTVAKRRDWHEVSLANHEKVEPNKAIASPAQDFSIADAYDHQEG